MKKISQKAAIAALTALIGGGVLIPFQAQAASLATVANIQQTAVTNFNQQAEQAIQQLVDQGVLKGYEDGKMNADKHVTNAELIKMIVLALDLDQSDEAKQNEGKKDKWYTSYVDTAAANGLIDNAAKFQPNKPSASADVAPMIAKALQRDV